MYEVLVTALKGSGIPFAEYAWDKAPSEGSYGIIAPDGEASSVWGDNGQRQQAIEGTIDLFVRGGGMSDMLTIQGILARTGVAWRLNSIQYEPARRIRHFEWVWQVEVM